MPNTVGGGERAMPDDQEQPGEESRPFVPSPTPRTPDSEPEPEPAPQTEAAAEPETEPEPVDGPGNERERPRRAGRNTARTLLAMLSVLALLATGYAYVTLDVLRDKVHTTDALHGDPTAPAEDDGATDVLLIGTDARTDMAGNPLPLDMLKQLRTEDKDGGVNTDTMIILRFPRNGGKPSGVSIPRDTWVDVPAGGQSKINSVFGAAKRNALTTLRAQGKTDQASLERDSDQEGRKALVKTIQDFTQVRVDHYAEVSLLGFYLLTESLGGVEVCLNHATQDKDSGADFAAGQQTVSGGEALSFVRQRKNLPHGDLDRIVRQQTFLSSALRKVLSAGTLTSPSTMSGLMDTVHRSVVFDPGLDLLKFAEQMRDMASGDVAFSTIPVLNINGRSPDGQSIVEVDVAAVRQFLAQQVGRGAPQAGGGSAPGGAPGVAAAETPCVN